MMEGPSGLALQELFEGDASVLNGFVHARRAVVLSEEGL